MKRIISFTRRKCSSIILLWYCILILHITVECKKKTASLLSLFLFSARIQDQVFLHSSVCLFVFLNTCGIYIPLCLTKGVAGCKICLLVNKSLIHGKIAPRHLWNHTQEVNSCIFLYILSLLLRWCRLHISINVCKLSLGVCWRLYTQFSL